MNKFKKLRKIAGLTQKDVAEKLGISPQAVQKWEYSRSNPNQGIWPGLAELYNVSVQDMFDVCLKNTNNNTNRLIDTESTVMSKTKVGGRLIGSHPTNHAPKPNIVPMNVKVHQAPVISWVQAGDWSEVVDEYQPGVADEWIAVAGNVSKSTFGLRVVGDSMSPEFREGEVLIIDPEAEVISGKFVIAKNGDEATFKQLIIDGGSTFLRPINDRYPVMDMTGKDFRIVGVVVQKVKEY